MVKSLAGDMSVGVGVAIGAALESGVNSSDGANIGEGYGVVSRSVSWVTQFVSMLLGSNERPPMIAPTVATPLKSSIRSRSSILCTVFP